MLPFADMSADRDQEYFNNGVAEELLNAFAKIDELKEGRKRDLGCGFHLIPGSSFRMPN